MRISHPLPTGKGIFVSAVSSSRQASESPRRIAWCIAAIVTAFLAAGTPAHAANVSATLHVDLVQYDAGATVADCQVSVPEEADGVAVLDAAKAAGCIDTYETTPTAYGRYLNCINGICAQAVNPVPNSYWGIGTFWQMRENGDETGYGIDDFEAQSGDELSFTYLTWTYLPTPPEVPEIPEVPPSPY
jgi:hypothetical protein